MCVCGVGLFLEKLRRTCLPFLMTCPKAFLCLSSHTILLLVLLQEEGEKAQCPAAVARDVRNIVWASICLFHFVTISPRPPHLTSVLWIVEMRNFTFRLPWD